MAVSVGEIEATLRLKDELTKQLNAAVNSIQQASAKVATFGNQFGSVNTAMASAGSQAKATGAAMASAAAQTGILATQAVRATNVFLSTGLQLRRIGEDLRMVGSAMTTSFTVPLAGAGIAAFSFGKDFEAAMLRVSTLSGVSKDRIAGLSKEVLSLSEDTARKPLELARALLVVTSTGLRGAEAMQILRESAKSAAVGLGDAKDVARTLTAAMTAYGKENLNAADAAAKLFVAVREGGAEAEDFARTLGRVFGIAAQVGVSFDEVVASVATFTRLGVRADEAVTALRGTLATLLKPSAGARDELRLLGTSVEELRAKVGKEGLAAALIDLVKATEGNEDALAAVIPNIRALAGVMGNTVDGGKAYVDILNLTKNATTDLDDAVKLTKDTLDFKWNELVAGAQRLAIALADRLKPSFETLLRIGEQFLSTLDTMLKMFDMLPQPVQSGAIAILALTAALGPLLMLTARLVQGFGGLFAALGRVMPFLRDFFNLAGATGASGGVWARGVVVGVTNFIASVARIPGVAAAAGTALGAAGLAAAFLIFKAQIDAVADTLDKQLERMKRAGTPQGDRANAAARFIDPKQRAELEKINAELDKIDNGYQYPLIDGEKAIISKKSLDSYSKLGPISLDVAKAMNAQLPVMNELTNIHGKLGEEAKKLSATEALRSERLKAEAEVQRLMRDGAAQEIFLGKERGMTAKQLADLYRVSESAIEMLTDRIRANNSELKKGSGAWAEAERSMREFLAPVEQVGGEVAEAIKYYLRLGATQETLAKWFGVSAGAVRKLAQEMDIAEGLALSFARIAERVGEELGELAKKSMEFSNAAFSKNLTASADAWKEASTTRARISLDSYQYQLFLIKQEEKDRIESLDRQGQGYAEAMAGIAAVTDAKMAEAAQSWYQHLAEMNSTFETWAETISGWFSSVPTIIREAMTGGGGLGGAVQGLFSQIGGDLGLKAFGSLAAKASNFFASTFGIGVTSVLGAVIPGIGQVLGSLVGPMLAKMWEHFHKPEWKKLAHDIGRDWGFAISDGLAKEMEEDSKKFGRQAATLLNMDKIFGENGGINAGNFDKAFRMLHDVFSLIEQDQLTIAQGATIIDKNWKAMVAAGTDSFGFINDQLKELIRLNQVFGTNSAEIASFLKQQGANAISAGNAIIGSIKPQATAWAELKKKIDEASEKMGSALSGVDLQKASEELAIAKGKVDDLRKSYQKLKDSGTATGDQLAAAAAKIVAAQRKVEDIQKRIAGDALPGLLTEQSEAAAAFKDELNDLGMIAVATFGAAIASGMSFTESLAAAHEGLSTLSSAFQSLGIDVENPALKALMLQDSLLSKNKELITGVDGLGGAFAALSNLGLLNKDTFDAMTRTGIRMYTKIQAEVEKLGGDTRDALLPMQTYLHQAQKAAEELGIPLDENTQMLIDQSKHLGIWKEAGKSANEKMLDGLTAIVDKLDEFLRMLTGMPPKVKTKVEAEIEYTNPTGGGVFGGGTYTPPTGGVNPNPGGILDYEALATNPLAGLNDQFSSMTLNGDTSGLLGRYSADAVSPETLSSVSTDSHDSYSVNVTFAVQGGSYEEFESQALSQGGFVDQMIMKIAQDKYGWGGRLEKAVNAL